MKRPAFQFYPADWLNDLSLRQCSPMSRCLWIDMMCLMHDGEPYGALHTMAGDISPAFLARISGLTLKQVQVCLAEMLSFGVYSITEEGTIYSRRMVRDERTREARAKGGASSLDNPNVPRPKADTGRNGVRTNGRISLQGSFGGSPSTAASSSASSSASLTAAGETQQPPQDWPITAATVGRMFPLSDADIVQRIVSEALAIDSGITDEGLSKVIDSALKRNQTTAGLFLKTVPAVLRNRKARERTSAFSEQSRRDESVAHALDLYSRSDPETRSDLEKQWPELASLWPKGAQSESGRNQEVPAPRLR